MLEVGRQARQAARSMLKASGATKSRALLAMAEALATERDALQASNEKDLVAGRERGLEPALLDRLTLSDRAIDTMIDGLQQVAAMPDPVGSLTASNVRPNGMRVGQMRVPLGVIGIIYESRPNVTIDAAALCLKSGNAAILRGGSEALHSNVALGRIVRQGLQAAGLPATAVQVIDTPDRAAVGHLITMTEYIDVIIPRGGKGLISRLTAEARVPMIKHLDGNCHVYIDTDADLDVAARVAFNAKTYRYGVCGSMETLLVHNSVAQDLLPALGRQFQEHGVELRGCSRTQLLVPGVRPATEEDWATEFLGPILAIRIVGHDHHFPASDVGNHRGNRVKGSLHKAERARYRAGDRSAICFKMRLPIPRLSIQSPLLWQKQHGSSAISAKRRRWRNTPPFARN